MTGMTRDLTQTNGFGEFGGAKDYIGGPVEPLRVFTVLDSEEQASQIINGTALAVTRATPEKWTCQLVVKAKPVSVVRAVSAPFQVCR